MSILSDISAFFNEDNEKWFFERKENTYKIVTDKNERMAFLRAMVINKLVECASNVFLENYDKIMEGTFKDSLIANLHEFENNAMEQCRNFSISNIYLNPAVVKIELTGFNVIGELMNIFVNAILNPQSACNKRLISLIPVQFHTTNTDTYSKVQVVLDYISNMTDLYAVRLYKDLRGIE